VIVDLIWAAFYAYAAFCALCLLPVIAGYITMLLGMAPPSPQGLTEASRYTPSMMAVCRRLVPHFRRRAYRPPPGAANPFDPLQDAPPTTR
jgi:hypothetical protein